MARSATLLVLLAPGCVATLLSTAVHGQAPPGNPLHVEASIAWDGNVNRAREAEHKLIDRIYSLNLGMGLALPLGEHTRIVFSGFAQADKFGRHARLDRIAAGAEAEFQYRGSADFGAPTFGLLARFAFDEQDGRLRSGHRRALGVTYRQSLTDRIELFGALSGNARRAESAVFDGKDWSARVNLDYAPWRRGTVYLGAEYRRGDVVSSQPQSPAYAGIAKAFAPDDAFGIAQLTAYRFEAKTTLWTIGFNWALGPRDAIDVSVHRAESKATQTPPAIYSGANTYTANQLAAAYLMRF